MLQQALYASPQPDGGEVFVAPVSFAQQRLWLLDHLRPGLATYNVPLAARLTGPLRSAALAGALEDVVARHETLRTCFAEEDGEPVQLIAPALTVGLPLVDLRGLPAAEREAAARREIRRQAGEPFDLGRAPLLRVLLFQVAAEEHLLFLNQHHIVTDAWSLGLLLHELMEVYAAFRAGLPSPRPELPIQYADFAVWQRQWLQGEALERQLAPWRRRLQGAPANLALPTDRPRRAADAAGDVLPVALPDELSALLRDLSRQAGATLFMTLLASYQTLLLRHGGQTDLVVGSPVANRNRLETEGLIGFFVNTLALRGDLSGDPSFHELLGRVREVALEAFAHEDLPFEKLVEELRPERRLAQNPLFRVAFGFQQPPETAFAGTGLRLELLAVHSGTAKFDLSLHLVDSPAGIYGFWEYATALFEPATLARLSRHWQILLADAARHPERRLSELALLTAAERHQLAAEWNDGRTAYPRDETIPRLFAAQAARTPDAPALVSAAGTVTYRELARRSRRLARRLRGSGVHPDDRVGVLLDRGPEMVISWLGILAAGGAYLPLDPSYPAERLAFMLADGRPRALITRRELLDRLPGHGATVLLLDGEEEESGQEEDLPAGGARAENLAYVVYTSGSTGTPKGVAVPHRAVIRLVRETDYVVLTADDRIAQVSNASFDAATFEVWGALLHGARLVLIERDVTLSPEELSRALREQRVTAMFLTTALFNRMVSADPRCFETVRHLLVGGDAVDPARAAEVLAAAPPERLLNGYGPTEGTTFTAWHPIREVAAGTATVPIGRPLANTAVTLLDGSLRPVPIGVPGELYIGGDGLSRGYFGQPGLTAERFLPRPAALGGDAAPGARLYRTGDLARCRPDGAIEFLGRLDGQVKIRGFRVEPAEVEAALGAHPALGECCVAARSGAAGERILVAWIVPRRPPAPTARELREFLLGKLPEAMVPAAFVEVPGLPRTPNGKVDRAALPDPAAESEAPAGHVPPRTPVEEVLAGIWSEVLRTPRVGAHDNFFDLGGHSLTATAVTSLARATFHVELATRTVFERPTLAELAGCIEELLAAGEGLELPPILPAPRTEDAPLSFAQQRLWFLDELAGGESPFYNIAAAFSLTGRLDAPAFAAALDEIVRRHEALRTTFHAGLDGKPVQVVHPHRRFELPLADLRSLPPAAREAEALRLARLEASLPFSLTTGPLLRVGMLRLGDERHALLLSMHHIVSDGWSLEVFVRELAALYTAFAARRPSPLPELPVQYADFAIWQRRWLAGHSLDAQLAYWQRQLAGAPLVLEVPADRPRPAVQTYDGGVVLVHLPAALAERFHALARQHRVTLFMFLFAAFASLLQRYTGLRDLLLGTPIANRNRAETSKLIGFFVNMLVLRADLAGDPGFDRALARVREMALGAFAHQDLPFERLVEELQPARDLSRHPLFQVAFAMGSAPWHALDDLPGLSLGFLDAGSTIELYDLTLQITETSYGLDARLAYNADLFEPVTIQRMGRRLGTLIASLVDDPRRPAGGVDLLDDVERRQLLADWSGAAEVAAAPSPVHALIEEQARRRPAAAALKLNGGELSYEELDRRANRLAHHLRSLGVGAETVVGLLLNGTADFAAAILAVWKAGGAFLPLGSHWPRERLVSLLEDGGARVLVTRTSLLEAPLLTGLPTVHLDGDREAIARRSPERPATNVDPDQLAYVIYTSGSTGKPKGVLIGHGALARHCLQIGRRLALGPEDRVLHFSSFVGDVSLEQIFPALLAGAAVVPWDPEIAGPAELVRELREHRVTVANLPTVFWHRCAQEWAQGQSRPEAPALRWMLVGGEALPIGALGLWRRTPLAAVPLVNAYGPTETTITATMYQPLVDGNDPLDLDRLPIGRPLAPRSVYLLDAAGNLALPGTIGEVFLGGPALARGYLGRPDLTAAAFLPDPFGAAAGSRLYRTGDLARFRADGNLAFLGRRDGQVKLRGYRIEPGEIEAALARHPGVRTAAVVLAEGVAGPETRTLAAHVVAVPGAAPSPGELRDFLREKLPDSMVPASYVLVPDLPLTATGKLDRAALARSGPRPQAAEQPAAEPGRGPEVENLLSGLWQEVLGIDEVGLDDNFFDLGGHSMLIAWVRAKLRETLGVELEMIELFNHPTVRSLAASVRRELGSVPPPPSEVPVAAPAPGEEPAAEPSPRRGMDVAIVGMAGRFPGAGDVDELWRNLRDGVESISFFAPEGSGWKPPEGGYHRVPARGVLAGADLFDAAFFGCSPREAELMDPQHRLFLECAWEALENAGYDPERFPGAVGVFGGASKNDYLALLMASGALLDPASSQLASLGNDRDNLTTRVSYKLALEGPSLNVQTACSTSLVAVHLACQSLLAGECDMALAGGVSVGDSSKAGYSYRKGDVLSPDGHCRAFDARAAGAVDSDGVALVVLKRLEDALAAGDRIHAVIKGSGINNDGAGKVGFSAPRMATQSRLIRSTLERAGIPAETITYVEAHGTATPLGDPIEVAALTAAFRETTDRQGFCALGSIKTNLGHTNSAAGVAGLIKTALALEHRQIPPSLHFEAPNPALELAGSPFFVNARLRDWRIPEGMPRRAGVSSFGVGGTNAHVVLEEAPPLAASGDASASHPWKLLTLSARSERALDVATARLALHLERHPGLSLSDVAFTLQVGRRAFEHRRAVLCRDLDEAIASLGDLDPGRTATGMATRRPAVVFLFPGQGAQRPGLGAELYAGEPVFRSEVDRCAELLRPHLGRDLRAVLFPAGATDGAEIDRTELTQPALFALEWALARTWMAWGVAPQAMLGHSLGEYVAACLAGVFSLPDALALVAARGRLIQGLPAGAMLAVPLPPAELEPLLEGGLSLAAVNGPSRCVLSGPEEAVAALQERLARRGVAGKRLDVSHAFHSAMMDPILPAFAAEVRRVELRPPATPFLSNVTGRWIEPHEATDPDYWVRHLRGTVRFADAMAELLESPSRVFLEVGPGRSLANAVRQVQAGKAAVTALPSLPQPGETLLPEPAYALYNLGRLWTAGIEVDWPALHAAGARRRVPLPTYPFERRRFWVEPRQGASPASEPRRSEDPADWFHVPFWRPGLPAPGSGDPGGPRLLFLDRCGVGLRLGRRLRESGIEVVTVEPGPGFARTGERSYAIRPDRSEDYDTLIADLGRRDLSPAAAVHLWNVTAAGEISSREEAEVWAFRSPLFLAQALGPDASARGVRVTLVSTGLQRVTGREAIGPEKALLLGPCRVIPQRFPGLSCRAVDVELPAPGGEEELAALLRAELRPGGDEPVVAYRNRQRWSQGFSPVRLEAEGPVCRFRDGGVYLVTGGFGGIGSTIAELLFARCRARLVLIGRSAPPGPAEQEEWLRAHPEDERTRRRIQRLRFLEEQGAEVLALRADVTDPAALREVRRRAEERFGAIHGIVHAAGSAGRGLIDWRKPEAAAEAFAAKVSGTLALAGAFDDVPLDFFVLCSSLGTLLGGIGQVDYTAANAFLDAFAWSRSGDPRTLTVAIDWDLWSEVGLVVDSYDAVSPGSTWERRKAGGLTSRQGAEAFQRILGYGFPQVVVAKTDLGELIQASSSWRTSGFQASRDSSLPAPPVPAPPSTVPAAARPDLVEGAIAEIWRELLGVGEAGPRDNFFELGGDSLIALGLTAKLHDRFRVELSPSHVYEASTLADLAGVVRGMLDGAEIVNAPSAGA